MGAHQSRSSHSSNWEDQSSQRRLLSATVGQGPPLSPLPGAAARGLRRFSSGHPQGIPAHVGSWAWLCGAAGSPVGPCAGASARRSVPRK